MDSEFEKRLRGQPVKQVPAEWRAEILKRRPGCGSQASGRPLP